MAFNERTSAGGRTHRDYVDFTVALTSAQERRSREVQRQLLKLSSTRSLHALHAALEDPARIRVGVGRGAQFVALGQVRASGGLEETSGGGGIPLGGGGGGGGGGQVEKEKEKKETGGGKFTAGRALESSSQRRGSVKDVIAPSINVGDEEPDMDDDHGDDANDRPETPAVHIPEMHLVHSLESEADRARPLIKRQLATTVYERAVQSISNPCKFSVVLLDGGVEVVQQSYRLNEEREHDLKQHLAKAFAISRQRHEATVKRFTGSVKRRHLLWKRVLLEVLRVLDSIPYYSRERFASPRHFYAWLRIRTHVVHGQLLAVTQRLHNMLDGALDHEGRGIFHRFLTTLCHAVGGMFCCISDHAEADEPDPELLALVAHGGHVRNYGSIVDGQRRTAAERQQASQASSNSDGLSHSRSQEQIEEIKQLASRDELDPLTLYVRLLHIVYQYEQVRGDYRSLRGRTLLRVTKPGLLSTPLQPLSPLSREIVEQFAGTFHIGRVFTQLHELYLWAINRDASYQYFKTTTSLLADVERLRCPPRGSEASSLPWTLPEIKMYAITIDLLDEHIKACVAHFRQVFGTNQESLFLCLQLYKSVWLIKHELAAVVPRFLRAHAARNALKRAVSTRKISQRGDETETEAEDEDNVSSPGDAAERVKAAQARVEEFEGLPPQPRAVTISSTGRESVMSNYAGPVGGRAPEPQGGDNEEEEEEDDDEEEAKAEAEEDGNLTAQADTPDSAAVAFSKLEESFTAYTVVLLSHAAAAFYLDLVRGTQPGALEDGTKVGHDDAFEYRLNEMLIDPFIRASANLSIDSKSSNISDTPQLLRLYSHLHEEIGRMGADVRLRDEDVLPQTQGSLGVYAPVIPGWREKRQIPDVLIETYLCLIWDDSLTFLRHELYKHQQAQFNHERHDGPPPPQLDLTIFKIYYAMLRLYRLVKPLAQLGDHIEQLLQPERLRLRFAEFVNIWLEEQEAAINTSIAAAAQHADSDQQAVRIEEADFFASAKPLIHEFTQMPYLNRHVRRFRALLSRRATSLIQADLGSLGLMLDALEKRPVWGVAAKKRSQFLTAELDISDDLFVRLRNIYEMHDRMMREVDAMYIEDQEDDELGLVSVSTEFATGDAALSGDGTLDAVEHLSDARTESLHRIGQGLMRFFAVDVDELVRNSKEHVEAALRDGAFAYLRRILQRFAEGLGHDSVDVFYDVVEQVMKLVFELVEQLALNEPSILDPTPAHKRTSKNFLTLEQLQRLNGVIDYADSFFKEPWVRLPDETLKRLNKKAFKRVREFMKFLTGPTSAIITHYEGMCEMDYTRAVKEHSFQLKMLLDQSALSVYLALLRERQLYRDQKARRKAPYLTRAQLFNVLKHRAKYTKDPAAERFLERYRDRSGPKAADILRKRRAQHNKGKAKTAQILVNDRSSRSGRLKGSNLMSRLLE